MKKILLISGGADSIATWNILKKNGEVIDEKIYFDYGQDRDQIFKEQKAINDNNIFGFNVIKLPTCGQLRDKTDTTHPFYMGRNMLFIIATVAMHGSCEIYFGTNKDDVYPDNNRKFFNELQKFIGDTYKVKVDIHTLLLDWKKEQVIKYCKDNKLEYYTD